MCMELGTNSHILRLVIFALGVSVSLAIVNSAKRKRQAKRRIHPFDDFSESI